MACPWLPDILCLSPWKISTYDELYIIFQADFIKTKPVFYKNQIKVPLEKEDGKEKIFWHLTSCDSPMGRLPELRRAERIHWIKPILENSENYEEILVFAYGEKKTARTYVWIKERDYLIVLKPLNGDRHLLLTAFFIDQPHTKRAIERKYRERAK